MRTCVSSSQETRWQSLLFLQPPHLKARARGKEGHRGSLRTPRAPITSCRGETNGFPLGCAEDYSWWPHLAELTVLEGSSEQVLGASSLWLCVLCAFLPLQSFTHSLVHSQSSSPCTWTLKPWRPSLNPCSPHRLSCSLGLRVSSLLWIELCPTKKYVEVPTPGTLFGNTVFADVTQLR